MISKIPERLKELRQENGYSQDELAGKILVTRQAISKWERGEALPDTENLIALANVYGISIDELLGHIPTVKKDERGDEDETASLSFNSEHTDGNDEESCSSDTADSKKRARSIIVRILYDLPYPILTTVIFLLSGFIWGAWDLAWIIFVTIPLYYSIVDCIKTRRLTPFNYPVFVTCVYLFIGMRFGLWHPGWIIYVTIPLFSPIAAAVDKKR